MKLSEALSGHAQAGAQRRSDASSIRIHRRQSGYHLTRTLPDQAGHMVAQTWQFPSLYALFLFARDQGFAEVDLDATDWCAVAE